MLIAMNADAHGSSAKAILYAFLANLGIAIAKTWAAMFTGSGSMLAEAIHSYADSANQVLLFLGLKQSQKPADAEHPLGYGKMSYFWSFIVAIMLFSVGGLFSIYEGLHKLQSSEPLNQAWVALIVLGLAIILEGLSLLGCVNEIGKLRKQQSLRTWLKETRNAELVVVFGEDIAALIGLVLAFGALVLTIVTGNTAYDALGSIMIGVVLITVSIFIALRIRSLLVGRSAEPRLQRVIDDVINNDAAFTELFNVITIQFGPKVMLAIKVRMAPDLTLTDAVKQINELERRIKAEAPEVGWCFVEPDNTDQ
jgi:cation diffusion facilitator family transporter